MGILRFFGKTIITLALLSQAYLLHTEPTVIKLFEKNLKALDRHELINKV